MALRRLDVLGIDMEVSAHVPAWNLRDAEEREREVSEVLAHPSALPQKVLGRRVEGRDVFLVLEPLGEPVAIEFTPTETGEVQFVCGMDMQRGTIAVVS